MSRASRCPPTSLEMNPQDVAATHVPQRLGRNRVSEHAVHTELPVHIDGQEHAGIRATGAHRVDQRPRIKYRTTAGGKISRRYSQRNSQLFESLNFEHALKKSDHALVRGESHSRNRPAREVTEAYPASDLFHFLGRDPTAVNRANQRAYAGACNVINRNVFFFEDSENTDMRDTPREPATQCNSQSERLRRYRRWPCVAARKLTPESLHGPNNPAQVLHWTPLPGSLGTPLPTPAN